MDTNNRSSIPTTGDQELSDLLAGLNQDLAEDASPSDSKEPEELVVDGGSHGSKAPAADEPEPAPATEDTATDSDAIAEAVVSVAQAVDDVPVATVPTPSPMDVIDDLNAKDGAPAESKTEVVEAPVATETKPTVAPDEGPVASPAPVEAPAATEGTPSASEELTIVREKVLDYLAGMVHQLDQPPQEKFAIIASILKSTGNRALIKDTLETAVQITNSGEKVKALVEFVDILNQLSHKD